MEKIDFFLAVFVISLISAFIITLLRKWKVIEKMQVHGGDLISEMARCNFCLSWWTNVAVCLIALIFIKEGWVFAIPFLSTMITRHIL